MNNRMRQKILTLAAISAIPLSGATILASRPIADVTSPARGYARTVADVDANVRQGFAFALDSLKAARAEGYGGSIDHQIDVVYKTVARLNEVAKEGILPNGNDFAILRDLSTLTSPLTVQVEKIARETEDGSSRYLIESKGEKIAKDMWTVNARLSGVYNQISQAREAIDGLRYYRDTQKPDSDRRRNIILVGIAGLVAGAGALWRELRGIRE